MVNLQDAKQAYNIKKGGFKRHGTVNPNKNQNRLMGLETQPINF